MIEAIRLFGDGEPELDGLVAHFATRRGGVSAAPFDSLNLGFSTGDDPGAVRENRRRLGAHLDAPLERWVVTGQVHGARVAVARGGDGGEGARQPSRRWTDRDAVLLTEPGVFALALSADCPLVVVADPRRRRAGIAHAGWRGTAAGVLDALLDAFEERGAAAAELWAAVSPGIAGERFPVGEDVREALAVLPGAPGAQRAGGGVDLRAIHRAILAARGVRAEAIRVSDACSARDAASFFSFRRDGRTGRNGALVGWRTAGRTL